VKPYRRLGRFRVRYLTSVAGHTSCPAILTYLAGTQHMKSRKHRKDNSYKQEVRKGDAIAYDQFLSTRHYHDRERERERERKTKKICFSVLFSPTTLHQILCFLLSFPSYRRLDYSLVSLAPLSATLSVTPPARSIPLST